MERIGTVFTLSAQWRLHEKISTAIGACPFVQSHQELALIHIPVYKSTKLHSTAGKAVYRHPKRHRHILLHPALLDERDPVSINKDETFLHEVAHHAAHIVFNERGHGVYWAYWMIAFGLHPERCYDATVLNFRGYKRRKVQRFDADIGALFNGQ